VLAHHPDLLVFMSHWAWQALLPWDARPWIAPHIAAPPTMAGYRENRDPAIAAILADRNEPALADLLRARVLADGRASAATAYREYVRRHPDRWGRTREAEVDALGYALLGEGRATAAAAILALNAEHYPDSANVWDSLGEATAASGDTAHAVEYYRKALALDPDLGSAQRALARLGVR
jgi:predicted Zn-dependent protease